MVIDFSSIGTIKEAPTLILRNGNGTPIQPLGYAFNLQADIRYNEISTITFDLPAYVDGIKTPHYDDVIGMRIIDMSGWGQFILMNPVISNDGVREIKSCKAYSLEYELTYKTTYFEEHIYKFYDPVAPNNTVLGMLLADLPLWTVGNVDDELLTKYCSISEESANVYNFIKNTAQKVFNCIFDFDTYHRIVHVRSVNSQLNTAPVYLSLDNLAKEIEVEEDTESIVTVLSVYGGEDVDIRMVNPLGSNKIYNLDYFMNETHFSQEIVDKWSEWQANYESNQRFFYDTSIERALKSAAILTEEAKLTDIEGDELSALKNERAVYIEFLAQLTDETSNDYKTYQGKLDDVNTKIRIKTQEVENQKTVISSLKQEFDALTDALEDIRDDVSFENFFSPSQMLELQNYFKEDSIEESSFVLSSVDSYEDSDISNEVSDIAFYFTNGKVDEINRGSLYALSGGGVVCVRHDNEIIRADVIKANVEYNKSASTGVLSIFLSEGDITSGHGTDHERTTHFPSGSLSLSGYIKNFQCNAVESEGDAYATGSALSFNVSSGQMYFTRNTTEYEQYAVEWDLYDYGQEILKSLAYPSYTFKISSGNFFALDEFKAFSTSIKLGERIYLNIKDDVLEPICVGVSIDFEDLASLSLLFGDKYSASDHAFKLVDLLEQSVSMGRTLDSNKLSYASFIDSGASNKVKDFMEAALDVAKNNVMSSSGQGIAWDETGLHLRKYIDVDNPNDGYENEQIWMMNNTIAFTDDGWQTVKLAIGKIVDNNIERYITSSDVVRDNTKTYYYLEEDGTYAEYTGDWGTRPTLYEKTNTAYGIAAPYIVGTMIAGQNLVIANRNGDFRVDESGVHVNALKMYITHSSGDEYVTFEDELNRLDEHTAEITNDFANAIETLSKRVDGTITTYYQASAPITDNEGDLWFDTSNGKLYMHTIVAYRRVWALSESYDETQKYYTYSEETHKYTRDISVTEENWDEKKYNLWVPYRMFWNPIEDAGVEKAISAAQNAQTTADGKIHTYYQSTDPSKQSNGDWLWDETERQNNIGDLWYDTSETGNDRRKLKRWNGTAWIKIEDGDIDDLKTKTEKINKTLSEVIDEEGGYLKAGQLSGVIETVRTQLTSAKGNVLFDDKGLWLLNGPSKEESTKAIWMNEEGILFGSGLKSNTPETDSNWEWTTAISHDGITAEALASKELTSVKIYGGQIDIGSGNFTVDDKGNLTARSGKFSGTLESPSLRGNFTYDGGSDSSDDKNGWIEGCGIKVGANSEAANGYNFYVDKDGNVTLSGSIKWNAGSSPVQTIYSPSDDTSPGSDWHSTYTENDLFVRYSYDGGTSWTDPVRFQGKDGTSAPQVKAQYSETENGPWHDEYNSNYYFARYSYDDGKSWTTAIRIQGEKGEPGDEAALNFMRINQELGFLFKDVDGGKVSEITNAYIYSPRIKGGEILASKFYAGVGDGYAEMNAGGFDVTDRLGLHKIGFGYSESGGTTYPYVVLGAGTGTNSGDSGLVMKFSHGLWIGTSNVTASPGSEPSPSSQTTGIFIDFEQDLIYQYLSGNKSVIGSGSGDSPSGGGGAVIAVFG